MCDKAGNTYHSTIKFISNYYKTQECVIKLLIAVFLHLFILLIDIKLKKMCDRITSEDPFMLLYCPDRYKTQRMCGRTVDDCLAGLKFIPDWFFYK